MSDNIFLLLNAIENDKKKKNNNNFKYKAAKIVFSFKCYSAVGCRVYVIHFLEHDKGYNTVYQKMGTHDIGVAKLPNHNAV